MAVPFMSKVDYERFKQLDFRKFVDLARDPTLSKYEKIGFPDSYRAGYEAAIFADIRVKLPNLAQPNQAVLDIGPGCSDLPGMLIELCDQAGHELVLVDSHEMLTLLPDRPFVRKISGLYPACGGELTSYHERINVILCYSVLQYVVVDADVFDFLDLSMSLLAAGGAMLIGDIPNESMRERFLKSEAGIAFRRQFSSAGAPQAGDMDRTGRRKIDDGLVLALLARARAAGAHAYVVEQAPGLPMANRREDILIRKP
jgi:hypothetical protein